MKKYLTYLPEFFSRINEFRAIASVVDCFIEEAYEEYEKIKNGLFIETASGEWLTRHEKFYSIMTKANESDEERRFRLMTVATGELPYTMTTLKQKLNRLTGDDLFEISCDPSECTLTVKIGLEAENAYELISEMLRQTVPANILLTVIQQYKTYGEVNGSGHTHAEMSGKTYGELRRGK